MMGKEEQGSAGARGLEDVNQIMFWIEKEGRDG
jgi:hypothetical protein